MIRPPPRSTRRSGGSGPPRRISCQAAMEVRAATSVGLDIGLLYARWTPLPPTSPCRSPGSAGDVGLTRTQTSRAANLQSPVPSGTPTTAIPAGHLATSSSKSSLAVSGGGGCSLESAARRQAGPTPPRLRSTSARPTAQFASNLPANLPLFGRQLANWVVGNRARAAFSTSRAPGSGGGRGGAVGPCALTLPRAARRRSSRAVAGLP